MAARPRHDVFRATLRVDELVQIDCDWTFRVFADGTLTVQIQRPDNWRERLAPDSNLERLERELAYSYVSYDGRATPTPMDVGRYPDGPRTAIGESPGGYSCTFHLAKCGPEGESWTVAFAATLCPTNGFHGHWHHESVQEYALWQQRFGDEALQIIPDAVSWVASVDPVVATLAPLTVGTYALEGCLMDDGHYRFIVPISIKLVLHADGSLTGSSISSWGSTRDDEQPETAMLSGSWTRHTVDITQSFEFHDAPDELFAFHGRVSEFGIAGEWAVVELEALGEWEDSDHQRFHLRVTQMERPWSPQEHALFPTAFRSAVRTCLLSSLLTGEDCARLPSVLWLRVLSFCSSDWFFRDE
jgi:hypothetical protein